MGSSATAVNKIQLTSESSDNFFSLQLGSPFGVSKSLKIRLKRLSLSQTVRYVSRACLIYPVHFVKPLLLCRISPSLS